MKAAQPGGNPATPEPNKTMFVLAVRLVKVAICEAGR